MKLPEMSDERLEQLSRVNGIASNVWNLDSILKVLSYSSLYAGIVSMERNGGKETRLSQFLLDLFTKVTDARFINRIGSFPATLEGLYRTAASKDKSIFAMLTSIKIWSMLIYSPMEHLWLLSTFKPKMININSDWWSMWSCRAWAAYVLADLYGTFLNAKKVDKEIAKAPKSTESDLAAIEKLKEKKSDLYLWFTCALTDLVMAANWSVPAGPVSNKQIALVGIYGGCANLYLKWKASRPSA
mmetsp:Transcript_19926/g.35408  ORF Transcript_19926/g.35408 Transcript_19926/m.35408 type:complete len:243 (-) Transcript_19926:359-1087(-)|eukprot:CAMPEP_0184520016 /NCGR_PEP_ID=MMETSP0198_2-20121128/6937_1 /TAXON_ID=1112570 /ORGANISM="Thraustochytrium sp., Strain LLF1b" /LENGTH=242 /DNA_ID=CAMNT_0026910575 /DNA_START=226 /DNA_END=954 /DNA_ORIENTATION=-